jgi:hypothetical protein
LNSRKLSHDKSQGKLKKCSKINWLAVSKHWCNVETDDTTKHEDWKLVFANHGEEDESYSLPTMEIAEALKRDQNLKIY